MHDRLDDIHEQLLRAGLSPSRARRYIRELSEHRQDLSSELENLGLDPMAALQEADRRLGATDALLLPMLIDRRFVSAASRWPGLFFFVLPIGALGLIFAASVALLIIIGGSAHFRPHMPDLGQVTAILWLVAPVLIAWVTVWSARGRRTAPCWSASAAIAVTLLASALQLEVDLPTTGVGMLGLSIGMPALVPALALTPLALLPLLLRKAHG